MIWQKVLTKLLAFFKVKKCSTWFHCATQVTCLLDAFIFRLFLGIPAAFSNSTSFSWSDDETLLFFTLLISVRAWTNDELIYRELRQTPVAMVLSFFSFLSFTFQDPQPVNHCFVLHCSLFIHLFFFLQFFVIWRLFLFLQVLLLLFMWQNPPAITV